MSGGPNGNPPNCTCLDNRVFENFKLANEPFAKVLRIFETCVLVNNNLCGKLISSLEFLFKFDERFKVTSVLFLIPDSKLLSCELYNYIMCITFYI